MISKAKINACEPVKHHLKKTKQICLKRDNIQKQWIDTLLNWKQKKEEKKEKGKKKPVCPSGILFILLSINL